MLVRPLVLATVPAAAAVLLFAGTASAAVSRPLHSPHRNTTAAGFKGEHKCDQIPVANRGAGRDGFVFVLPKNDAVFVNLNLSFRDTGGNTVPITIPNELDAYPDGITTNGASKAWIVVPSGWTLLDGSALVSNDKTKADFFNLSHTCVGGAASPSPSKSPSKSPSASPSTSSSTSTSPSASESTSESPSASPSTSGSGTPEASTEPSQTPSPSDSASTPVGGGGGGGLPVTGVAVGGTALAGAALVAGGVALLAVRRRRAQLAFVADPDAHPSADGK
ncbi:hypothetical protein ABT297_15200 [Dactylosporangium sp. NPDC000555]|uniref:hypothetical protein n=1 Tax=Dactylosporangium sp. NPDC000555 TaxID=3154260 RepID=UPI0033256231